MSSNPIPSPSWPWRSSLVDSVPWEMVCAKKVWFFLLTPFFVVGLIFTCQLVLWKSLLLMLVGFLILTLLCCVLDAMTLNAFLIMWIWALLQCVHWVCSKIVSSRQDYLVYTLQEIYFDLCNKTLIPVIPKNIDTVIMLKWVNLSKTSRREKNSNTFHRL